MAKKRSSKRRSNNHSDPLVPGTVGLPRLRDRAEFVPGSSGDTWSGWFQGPIDLQNIAELLAEAPLEKYRTSQLRNNLLRLKAGRAELLARFPGSARNAVQRKVRESLKQVDLAIQRFELALVGKSSPLSHGSLPRKSDRAKRADTLETPSEPKFPAQNLPSRIMVRDRGQHRSTVGTQGNLKYRSELKRAISFGLTRNPFSTDRELCRWLDADGAAELPARLAVAENRSFEDAYKRRSTKQSLEVTISKVRKDMRRRGLLPDRSS